MSFKCPCRKPECDGHECYQEIYLQTTGNLDDESQRRNRYEMLDEKQTATMSSYGYTDLEEKLVTDFLLEGCNNVED
jgi:hypothetical protein